MRQEEETVREAGNRGGMGHVNLENGVKANCVEEEDLSEWIRSTGGAWERAMNENNAC